MYGPWDAPLELQYSLLDEGDPPPVESTTQPDFMISLKDDPDAAFRFSCAYAAQAIVLDECWEGVLQAVETAGGADEWLVMLIGARGYPLGEHHRVGGVDPRLYSEQLHVPWIIRFPKGVNQLARSGGLKTHLDLLPTLVAAATDAKTETANHDGVNALTPATTPLLASHDALIAAHTSGTRAIRTSNWCLRLDSNSSFDAELYVRPDDRWEANDVAKLCPDVVELLSLHMDSTLKAQSGPMPDAEK
jgi:arylsulfatase A-like enzyme